MDDKYISELEDTVRKFLVPLRELLFPVIIKAISGFSVLPFPEDPKLVNLLKKAFDVAAEGINLGGIKSRRPNEVGNYIEPFIRDALSKVGFHAETPFARTGKRKATGYPDIELTFGELSLYVECKTYNLKNINTTQRAFYFSPSDDFKVTKDAVHLLSSFQMEERETGTYYARHWRLYSLENLKVDLKHEFNQSNRYMYGKESCIRFIMENDV